MAASDLAVVLGLYNEAHGTQLNLEEMQDWSSTAYLPN